MNNEESGLGKGLLIGFLTGAAVGSIIALLFAPKSGKELREDIKNKSQDFMEDAENYVANAKDKASQLINEGKKKSEKLSGGAWIQSRIWGAPASPVDSKDNRG